MKRLAVLGLLLAAVLLPAIFVRCDWLPAAFSDVEFALVHRTPSLPPNYNCLEAQRTLAEFPIEKAVRNSNPLTEDEIAIYDAVLEHWTSGSRGVVNLSNTTFPFDRLTSSDCDCTAGVDVQGLLNASRSFHVLRPNALRGKSVRIVDPKSQAAAIKRNDPQNSIGHGQSVRSVVDRAFAGGIFELSEIAFDKDHRHAAVTYSFECGELCGSGGTWAFEKVAGKWKSSDHACGGWIS